MIIEKIKSTALASPNLTAVYDETGSISYHDLMTLVSKLAFEFKHLIGQKSVGIVYPDSIIGVAIRLSLAQLGITYVQLPRRLPAEEVQRRCRLSQCNTIITNEHYESLGTFDTIIIENLYKYDQCSDMYTTIHSQPDDELCISWSSGTGGKADGLVHSHRSMFHVGIRLADHQSQRIENGTVYTVAPLETTFGLMMLHAALLRNAGLVVESRPFSPSIVSNNIRKYKVTNFASSPPIYSVLLRRKALPKHAVPNVCASSGDLCSIRLQQQWQEEYGTHLYNFLGSSQNGLSLARMPGAPWGALRIFDSELEVELRDAQGNVVQDNEPGEIWMKTKCNAVREITEGIASLVDGWLTTRDILIKKQDYFYMQGRSKDTFKTSGKFVSPIRIEDTIRELPEVDEVVAVHALDDNGLSCVKVCIVPTHTIDLSVLQSKIKFHTSKLESHERPKLVEIIDKIPMHPVTMKIQRGQLRT
jgi:acyl-coenzyme A synthetase/AMP-(fatty) acid ligase